jgi:type II secretory pathway component PulM
MAIGNVKGWFGRPLAYVGSEWNRMAPRERRLVAGLVAAVMAFAVLVTGFLIVESLRDIATSNDDAREALAAIAKHRDEYLEAKERMMTQEARIGTEPPQFAADLEAAAHEVGIGIPETQEQPSAPIGRRYVEHKVDVKLRQVDLQSLTKFLNKLETGRRLIMVNSLRVRKRFSDQDKLDVDFTATAFERLKDNVKKRPLPAGGKQ